MKKPLLFLALSAVILASSCSKKEATIDPVVVPPVQTSTSVEVSGDIATNTTWTADKIYTLKGFVYVTEGATLTIEPGTIVKGDKATKGTLIITRGAKIMAVGTASKPIVFTSSFAAGTRAAGDWGGLILLGKAPVNSGDNVNIEGGLDAKGNAAKYIQYGGTVANDNSGTIKYVRVEYAGVPFSPDNEINGITFGGVGSGTTIEYVEVYRSGDDAYEWFGGSVNAKHLLAIGSLDDDFDTDNGFSGKVQFGLAQRYPTIADVSGSNAFESDNDKDGSNKTPQTTAIFSNMTLLGPVLPSTAGATLPTVNANHQHAAQIRRNSSESIFNSVFSGFQEGIYIDDSKVTTAGATSANFVAGRIGFANNIIYGCNKKSNEVKGENKSLFEATLRLNNVFDAAKYADALINDPFKFSSDFALPGTPVFTVKTGSIAATGAIYSDTKIADTFFDKVAYRGAFGTDDWSAGWANYNPQVLPYTTPGAVN
ncbi:hypothetical protein [Mucilaginibacter phyllosphaerae]|uniref:T9SS C-terminal target domain-containing protein n=1 Tax=Mucilaginibacter phyllosphaerae TaxID=1812349 RepID=A0A4Y8AGT7_9SPHI|nr:hypothetical protein [Mucilaginibacter phyllosphaerae]MBB3968412.1 hypothetical protein [Mucilaginibacter phyllosphaerae]TEW67940.1 hypothetical protein E2R65_08105 [Mucilaginibacter phyllosphaerae]GGH16160.1 hypothetical protein GCM10007352_25380 [Mucilaginibacter phyllosphaerae]